MSSKVFVTGAAMAEFANKLREGSGYSDLISFPQGFTNLYSEYSKYQAFKIQPNTFDDFIEGKISIVNTYSTFLRSYLFTSDNTITKANLPFCRVIAKYCFKYCKNLTSVNAPNCIRVNDYCFEGCSSLSYISIPNCSELGYDAFNQCNSLTIVDLPSCTYISPGCFRSCVNLFSVNIPLCWGIGYEAFTNTAIECIDFPNVSSIGTSAFAECSNLTQVNLPAMESIPNACFKNCSKLSSFSFSNIDLVGTFAFQGCGLTSLNTGYLIIGSYAFLECNSLQTVSVSYCKELCDGAFKNCTKLKNIYIGDIEQNFGSQAFKNCTALSVASVGVTDNLVGLPIQAFEGCSSLHTVYISGRCAPTIESSCFKDCISLMSVYIDGAAGMNMQIFSGAFQNTPLTTSSLTGAYGSIYVKAYWYSALMRNNYFNGLSARVVSY